MKLKMELAEHEIKQAIALVIKDKLPGLNFFTSDIQLEGSVKVRGKAVRKKVVRIRAFLETTK